MRRITLHTDDTATDEQVHNDLACFLRNEKERRAMQDPGLRALEQAAMRLERQIRKNHETIAKLQTEAETLRKALEPLHIAANNRRKDLGLCPTAMADRMGW